MKQPQFYMTAIFCDPRKHWLVLFSLTKSKKAAAEIAFEWMKDKCNDRFSAKSLQKYTSLVFHDDGQYWVRPKGWGWSSILPKELCCHFSFELTEQAEITQPIRIDGPIPTTRADVAFVFGDHQTPGRNDYFPSDETLAKQAERNLEQFARTGRGKSQFDIRHTLEQYGSRQGYEVDFIADCECSCDSKTFELLIDSTEGVAQRVCIECGKRHTIADGAEYMQEVELLPLVCDCHERAFEISVGLNVYRDSGNKLSDHVRWFYLGVRCPACQRLQVASDWKNDYQPVEELLEMI